MADEQLEFSPDERAGGYISKIQFNTGEEIELKKDDIVIFVGPNNAGKSQALRDIYELCKDNNPRIIVDKIYIEKYKYDIFLLLNKISTQENYGNYTRYRALNAIGDIYNNDKNRFYMADKFNSFRDFFVVRIDTQARLGICNAVNNIRRDEHKVHPIHFAAFNGKIREKLSKSFKKAFGEELIPNTNFGGSIPLCIGNPIKLQDEYRDEQERQEAYASILEKYKQVQNQGDGIKSFTGILLYLMLDYFCIYLIDEPESFLHPPQARIMGEIIGETLSHQQQAFISTHSEEIIKGLLDVCPDRIKIIRITREGDENFFSVLDNEKIREIWNDPLLKYSNIMSSLFHKTVVLCESDSDCKMYSLIDNYLQQKEGKYSETLFIQCSGKHRIPKIAQALRALNIDVRIIADIDILNEKKLFRNCVETCGVVWDDILESYNTVISSLNSQKYEIYVKDVKERINNILNGISKDTLSNKDIENIEKVIKKESVWKEIKRYGDRYFRGGVKLSFDEMSLKLKKHNFYIVTAGELESFIPEVGSLHGPEWVNKVLEQYPNFDNDVYKNIRDFISSMHLNV